MQTIKRKRTAAGLLFSFLTLGALTTSPQAARAADIPIVVGKPIIHKDPKPKPHKDQVLPVTTMGDNLGKML